MMLLPFLLLGLPFTPSSIIVSNIMDVQVVNVIELAKNPSTLINNLTVFDSLILLSLVTVVFYYILSLRFINFYTALVKLSHSKLKILLIAVIGLMIYLDISIQEISIINYFSLMVMYLCLGFVMKRFKINPMPFIFVYLLVDVIIWTTIQFFLIHF